MSQDIKLKGSWANVPGVNLPTQSGGMAYFVDTSDADASASDVATGKTCYVNGVKITGTGSSGSVTLQTKTKSYTPGDTTQTEAVTADSGYDGLQEVDITVAAVSTETASVTPTESAQTITPSASGVYLSQVTVAAVSSSYIGSGITQRSSSDLTVSGATVTAPAGYYSTAASASIATVTQATPTVSISSAGLITATSTQSAGYVSGGTTTGTLQLTARTSSDLTVSGDTVTAPAGYYDSAASASVAAGSATTPATTITTSPTLSWNAGTGEVAVVISETHSITPTVVAGYISAGTAGTITLDGTDTLQLNTQGATTITPTTSSQTAAVAGTYLTGNITVDAIPSSYIIPSGSQTATANGTYDVTALAEMIVNVASGSSGLEYETGTYTPSSDTAHPTISFSNSHSNPPVFAAIVDTTGTSDTTTNTTWACVAFNFYRLFGNTISYGSSVALYGYSYYTYRGSSTTSLTASGARWVYPDTNSSSSSSTYARYWITESAFKPYSGSSSRYFRSGRTYSWIAIWN